MVKQAGSDAIIVQADLTNMGDIKKLVDAAYDKFGSLEILVNKAGVEKEAPFT